METAEEFLGSPQSESAEDFLMGGKPALSAEAFLSMRDDDFTATENPPAAGRGNESIERHGMAAEPGLDSEEPSPSLGAWYKDFTAPVLPEVPKVSNARARQALPGLPEQTMVLATPAGPVVIPSAEALAGLARFGAGAMDFVSSPASLAGMGAGTIAPRAVAGLFAADMARHEGEAARAAGEASVSGDEGAQVEAGLGLAANTALAGLAGIHAGLKGKGMAGVEQKIAKDAKVETEAAVSPDVVAELERLEGGDTEDRSLKIEDGALPEGALSAEEFLNALPREARGDARPPTATDVQTSGEDPAVVKLREAVADLNDAPGAKETKGAAGSAERAPDVLDWMEGHGLAIRKLARGEDHELQEPLLRAQKATPEAFDSAGRPVDEVADAYRRETGKDLSDEDFLAEVEGVKGLRRELETENKQAFGRASQDGNFQAEVIEGARKAKGAQVESVGAEELASGDTFTVGGEKVVVEHVKARPEDETMVESVTVKDGPKFGTQVVGGDRTLKIDAGSLERGNLTEGNEGGGIEAWAARVIGEAKGRVASGLDPELLAAYAVKGAALIARGVAEAGKWAAAMVREHGETIREHLPAIRAQAEKLLARGWKASEEDLNAPRAQSTKGERAFPTQVDASTDVSDDVRLRQGPRLYDRRSNEGDAEFARRWVSAQGLEGASDALLAGRSGLHPAEESFALMEAAKAWGQREQVAALSRDAAGEKAAIARQVDLYEALTRRSTDVAQTLQTFAAFSRLTPAGAIEAARRTIEGAREAGVGAMKPGLDNIKVELEKENEKVVPEVVDTVRPDVERAIEETPSRTTAVKAELARQILQLWNSLWTESKVWQDIVSENGMRVMEIARDHYAGIDPGKTLATKLQDELKIGVKAAFQLQRQLDAEYAKTMAREAKAAAKRAKEQAKKQEERRRKISTSGSVWVREKAAAVETLVKAVGQKLSYADAPKMTAVQAFARRLTDEMRREIGRRVPERMKAAAEKLSPEAALREAINNSEKYREVWREAQAALRDEFSEMPQQLTALDDVFGAYAPDLFSAKTIDVLIKREMEARMVDFESLVKKHFTEVDKTGKELAEKIAGGLGIEETNAKALAAVIEKRFADLATERKRAALRRLSLPARVGPTLAKGLHEKLIELSNIGALDDAAFDRAVAEKLKLPQWSREMAMEVKRRVDAMQKLPEGFRRTRAAIDLMNYLAKAKGMRWYDLPMAIWYANVLSGPLTHAVNAGANALNLAANIGFTMARQGGRGTPGLFAAVARGFAKGGVEAAQMMQSGVVDGSRLAKVEAMRPLELAELKGAAAPLRLWRYVGRAMGAADLLFFKSAEEMRSYAAAQEIGKSEGLAGAELQKRVAAVLGQTEEAIAAARAQADMEGLSGLDYKRRVAEAIEQSRPEILRENAKEYALRVTFNEKPYGALGAVAEGVKLMRRRVPALQYVVPFVDIVANVTNEGLNYFPPAGAYRALRGHWAGELEGRAITDRDVLFDQWAKATAGGVGLMTLAVLASQGKIEVTGAGPRTPSQRKELQETGWVPYSIKVGDKYYAYGWTPAAIPIAVLGNYLDAVKYKNLEATDAGNRAAYALSVFGKVVMQQSFLSGMADLVNWLDTDSTKKAGESAVRGLLRSAVSFAVPNAMKTVDQLFDPTIYDPSGIEGQLVAAVPFARRLNKPAINALGEPVQRYVSDRFLSSDRGDGLWNLLAQKQAWVSLPERDTIIGDKKDGPGMYRTLSDDEFYLYVLTSGRAIRQELVGRIGEIASATPEEAREIVRGVTEAARREAKGQF